MENRQKRYINRVQPGQTGFFTTTVLDFARAFDRPEVKDEMVRSLLRDLNETGSKLRAFAVMPHHIHFVATLSQEYDGRRLMNKVKRNSAKRILQMLTPMEHGKLDRQRGLNRRAFWKASFRSLPLVSGSMLEQKVDYIHANPVRGKLCEDERTYRWCSAPFWQDERYIGKDYVLDLNSLIEAFAEADGRPALKASTESCKQGVVE
jgi:REP element-mobilizing transposase RayT